jgi:hypothetical protein
VRLLFFEVRGSRSLAGLHFCQPRILTVCLCLRRVVPTVPPLAPAKVLRADASVPT